MLGSIEELERDSIVELVLGSIVELVLDSIVELVLDSIVELERDSIVVRGQEHEELRYHKLGNLDICLDQLQLDIEHRLEHRMQRQRV